MRKMELIERDPLNCQALLACPECGYLFWEFTFTDNSQCPKCGRKEGKMRRKRPENLAEVIEHCRDNGMEAIFCDMAVEWKDCQLQMMSVDGWKPMRVTSVFLGMDNWRLILDEPKEVEVAMSTDEDGLLRASSRLPKYINGVNTWMTLANDLTTIRGFVRFTWPEWVRGVVGDLYHPDVFRVWVDKKPNPTKRCYKYSAEFPHEVLATGALFLDYGDN